MDRLRRPIFDESPTATTRRAMPSMRAFRRASSRCGVITPISGSRPSKPRNRMSACRPSSPCSACGPPSEYELGRSTPPSMIRVTCGAPASSTAMFSALVITFTDCSFRPRICLAISAVVVPESSTMVCPSPISLTASSAMRTFSARCSDCLTPIGKSSSARWARAPPRVRTTAPISASTFRSARTVTSEMPNISDSSATVTRPRSATISRILRRRSATSRSWSATGSGGLPSLSFETFVSIFFVCFIFILPRRFPAAVPLYT